MVQCLPAPAPLDSTFGALADPTRRGILQRLGSGEATVSELAERFAMTLTGISKHVHVLETAGLVTTEKVGRVRSCRLGPRRLEDATTWITEFQLHSGMEEGLDDGDAALDALLAKRG